jgi:hypothetical protein
VVHLVTNVVGQGRKNINLARGKTRKQTLELGVVMRKKGLNQSINQSIASRGHNESR